MKKKRPNVDLNKIRGIEAYSYKRIKEFYNTEIESIIKMLPDKELKEPFKRSLRKYLIITLISSLEHFFKSEGKVLIDKNNLDVAVLFTDEKSFSLADIERMMQKDEILTKGNMVASNFSFGNIVEINHVFSKVLNLDFLDYIHKLNLLSQDVLLQYCRLFG